MAGAIVFIGGAGLFIAQTYIGIRMIAAGTPRPPLALWGLFLMSFALMLLGTYING